MAPVINVAFPVFAVIAAGLLAGRLRLAGAEDCAALNRFVFRFGFPAALFGLMANAAPFSGVEARLAVAYACGAVAAMGAGYAIARRAFRLSPQDAGAHAFASTIGNGVFLGLPIALAIDGWAQPYIALMLVEGILVIGLGAALMAPRATEGASGRAIAFLKRPLENPLVVAAFLGLLWSRTGMGLPAPIASFFDLLGKSAGPVALFSLGLFFATRTAPPLRRMIDKTAAVAMVKMALLPTLALAVAAALGVSDRAALGPLALFTFTPTAVGAYVMANAYGRYVEEVAAAIAVTTGLAVLSISAVLIVFT